MYKYTFNTQLNYSNNKKSKFKKNMLYHKLMHELNSN